MTRPLPAPTRDGLRRSIADELLEAELIAAEVAHQLAMARSALHRHPSLRRAG